MRRILIAAALFLAAPLAHAGPGETILRDRLNAARSADAVTQLEQRAQRSRDQQISYALGVARFVRAFERLGQGLYRYGYAGLDMSAVGQAAILALPVPPNPNPEPITYEALRALLAQFVDDLDAARAALANVTSSNTKLRLDLARVRLDFNGDGAADMTLADLMQTPGMLPSRTAPRPAQPRVFAFDQSDAIWLQGYAQLTASLADFLLAHDFHTLFDAVFHRFFPAADLPMNGRSGALMDGMVNDGFADAIAAVHFINWPVVEQPRRARVRARLLDVARLSRANWAAIRAERDNDREWLPNPRQTSPFPELEITDARIDAWLAFLTVFEAVLNGEKLMPHWRFQQGMDMRAFFESSEPFDIVSILTGYGALPYLKDGEKLDMDELRRLSEALGPNAVIFAAWFN